ncbi:hypothetical protein GGP73_002126 [Salinibacter ruber]|nr:hypothetical protein [Salinibacter ruber]
MYMYEYKLIFLRYYHGLLLYQSLYFIVT